MSGLQNIRDLLQRELLRLLSVECVEFENVSSPGAHGLAAGDRVRFRLVLRNDGDVPFDRIAGVAIPTDLARFAPLRFEVRDVGPGEDAVLGTIEGSVSRPPSGFGAADGLASVTLSAVARLSEMAVRETDRVVPYLTPRRSARRGRWTGPAPRSIPLSS
jgi:hypothetical protein